MIELGELEAKHEEFAKRKTRVVVASIEDPETAKKTQADFPNLVVVADAGRKLTDALAVLQPGSHPDGGDTSAPTTFLIDGKGTVRWIHRPERFLVRLSPAEVVAAVDEKMAAK